MLLDKVLCDVIPCGCPLNRSWLSIYNRAKSELRETVKLSWERSTLECEWVPSLRGFRFPGVRKEREGKERKD